MGTSVQPERPGLRLRKRKNGRGTDRVGFRGRSQVSLFLFLGLLAVSTAAQDLGSLSQQIISGNTEQKRDALLRVRNLRSAEASRLAVPALGDADEIVRATAAASVVFLSPTEAAGALLPLLSDKSTFVRKEAAYAMGAVGDPSAVSALTGLLNDKDLEVRSAAANAMGRIGDPAATNALLSILQRSPNEDTEFVRRSAARSIGQIAEFALTGRHVELTPQNFLPERYKVILPVDYAKTARFPDAGALLLRVFQNKRESEDTRREAAFALGSLRYLPAKSALSAGLNSDDRVLVEICKEALLKLAAVE
jgi:HEAT repeat protein